MASEISFNDEIEIEPIVGPASEPTVGPAGFDVHDHFVTDKVFEQREELINWAREIARGLGFVITIQKSDGKKDGKKSRNCSRVLLGCDRSGKYRPTQPGRAKMKRGIRPSSSRRCGCPFSLKGRLVGRGVDKWKVEVVSGLHNHPASMNLEGHSFARRLNDEQKNIVKELSRAGIKPRECLETIKKRDDMSVTTMKTIYNVRAAMRLEELSERTSMQHLYKCFNDAGYVAFRRMEENNENLTDSFFAHPTSISLSNAFPSVFLLDCNYKTTRFQPPLLSIFGVTSTQQIFISAVAFLSSEKESNYIWALECFKSILDPSSLPLVFGIDRELTLINAIKIVFPMTKNLLCLWHISKNVMSNCKKFFPEEGTYKNFMDEWNTLTRSPTVSDFDHGLMSFMIKFAVHPNVLSHVTLTWLIPYKEWFVAAWIDRHFHLGHTSASWVESAHSQLKSNLKKSISNMTTAWESIDTLINQHHTKIKASFLESRINMDHAYSAVFYNELRGLVSSYALGKIEKQIKLAEAHHEDIMVNAQNCQHVIRTTLGLPCDHELVDYLKEGKALPLSMIHDHWKVLSLVDEPLENDFHVDIAPEMELIAKRYENANASQKAEMKRKLRDFAELFA